MTAFPAPIGPSGGYAGGGVNYYKPHPKPAPRKPVQRQTVDPIGALVNQILSMQRAPLAATEAERQKQQAAQQQQLSNARTGMVAALTESAKAGARPYDEAIQTTDQLGRQAASYFQGENPNTANTDVLKAIGAPVAQQQANTGMAGQLFNGGPSYVLGAQIPGASLAAQKAAQVGYLSGLPTVAALQGGVAENALLQRGEQAHQGYLNNVQEILAQTPQLVQSYRTQAFQQANTDRDFALKQAAAAQNAAYLAEKSAADAGYKNARLNFERDKATNAYSIAQQNAEIAQQRADTYGVSVQNQQANQATTAATKAATAAGKTAKDAAKSRAKAVKGRGDTIAALTKDALKIPTTKSVTKMVAQPSLVVGRPGKSVKTTVSVQLTYQERKQQALALPEVRLLQARYGLSRAQVSKLIDQALGSKGAPRKARPKKKGKYAGTVLDPVGTGQ